MPRIEAIDGSDDGAQAHAAAADYHCRLSERIGWPKSACVAAALAGATTLQAMDHGCPARFDQTFADDTKIGWSSPSSADMRCRIDGRHTMTGIRHTIQGEFSRAAAYGVTKDVCQTFVFGRAKAAKQKKQTHSGPALLGTDRDLGKVLSQGRAGRFSLMNMGLNYTKRHKDGLWTPCTNVAFIMCALQGWLPGQDGKRIVHLATPGKTLMRRCRPCGECKADLFWDECYIVRNEYCMLYRFCANGHEIWDRPPGNWTCVPRKRYSKT